MNSNIRLESKYLLSKNNLRLFGASALSFSMRWGVVGALVWALWLFADSRLFTQLLDTYGKTVYFSIAAIGVASAFICALFCSAIKLGEEFVYFARAQHSKGSVRLLFKFLAPAKIFKALGYRIIYILMKVFWFIYFACPTGICIGIIAYLNTSAYLSESIYTVLLFGTSLLAAISLVMWRIAVLRYAAAPCYLCFNPDITVKDAFKKSVRFTDGCLSEGVLLEYSDLGWILSCIFIIPIFYVLPYIKLTKSVFVTKAVFSKAQTQIRYPINLLGLAKSSEHIN